MKTKDLVQRALKKDQSAMEELIHLTEKKARAIAYKQTNNEDIASDSIQEAYIATFKNLDKLHDQDNFEAWFYTILKNKIKDIATSSKAKLDKETSTFTDLERSEMDDVNFESTLTDEKQQWQPEANVNYEELKDGLHAVIQELNDSQRYAIISFYFENESIKEIAEEQNVSINTVKSWLNYGRKNIKSSIETLRQKNASFYSITPIPFLMYYLDDFMAGGTIVIQESVIIKSVIGTSFVSSISASITKAFSTFKSKIVAHKLISGVTCCCFNDRDCSRCTSKSTD